MKITQNKSTARKVAAKWSFKLTGLKSILDIRLGSTQLEVISTEDNDGHVSKSQILFWCDHPHTQAPTYSKLMSWLGTVMMLIRRTELYSTGTGMVLSWMQKREGGECRCKSECKGMRMCVEKESSKTMDEVDPFYISNHYKLLHNVTQRRTGIHNNEWATSSFCPLSCVPSISSWTK